MPALLRAMRPHQWVKNLFVLAPLVFAKELLEPVAALRSLAGLGLFCLASSTVYLMNDLADVERDREHPVKRHRPIASGALSPRVARAAAWALALAAIVGGWFLSDAFAGSVVGYVVLNWLYSRGLKRIPYVDVLCITTGFELRVLGGAFAANVDASGYLLVVTFLLAMFLGFGKRMHELLQGEEAHLRRAVLSAYNRVTLSVLLYVTAAATVITYAVYTLDHDTRLAFGTDYLVATTLMPAFGVVRFLHLVRRLHKAESPTDDMLRDVPFLANLVLWVAAVLLTIYLG